MRYRLRSLLVVVAGIGIVAAWGDAIEWPPALWFERDLYPSRISTDNQAFLARHPEIEPGAGGPWYQDGFHSFHFGPGQDEPDHEIPAGRLKAPISEQAFLTLVDEAMVSGCLARITNGVFHVKRREVLRSESGGVQIRFQGVWRLMACRTGQTYYRTGSFEVELGAEGQAIMFRGRSTPGPRENEITSLRGSSAVEHSASDREGAMPGDRWCSSWHCFPRTTSPPSSAGPRSTSGGKPRSSVTASATH